MRNFILLLSLLTTNVVFAESYQGTISTASELTQKRLMLYLAAKDGKATLTLSYVLDQVDEDYVEVSRVKIKGQVYEMLIVWSGGNVHGAVYKPGTFDMVGYNSDGEVYMYSADSADEWIEDVEFLD